MNKYPKYKSSGVEWIGDIPEQWKMNKVKRNTYVKGRIGWKGLRSEDFIDEGPYLITGTDFQKNGEINWDNIYHVSQERYDEDPFIQVMKHDVLITKDGSIGKVVYVKELKGQTCLNSGIFVTRPNSNEYNSKYFYWVLISDIFKLFVENNSGGSTIQHLYQNVFDNFNFPIPSITEQLQIVQYLDEKTELIDKLISTKERKIDLLKSQRTSLINEVITKGLDLKVKMKDSGVEWIGEIPEHWKFIKIGHYSRIIRGGSPRPSGDPRYFNGDFIPWITVGEVTNSIGKYITSTETMLSEEGMKQSRVIEPDTLLLSNSGATLGVPKITKIKGCINDGSVGFLNIKSEIIQDFLYFFLTTQTILLREQQSGYGQPNLNIDIVSNIRLPLPPLKEQTQIIEYIEGNTKEIDELVSMEQKKIDLLKEYRQSLISEVITGKIDVRTNLN